MFPMKHKIQLEPKTLTAAERIINRLCKSLDLFTAAVRELIVVVKKKRLTWE